MTTPGAQLAAAALSYVGTPYRLGGRSREGGVDCVGLVLCALRDIGQPHAPPPPYGLRNFSIARHLQSLVQAGFAALPAPLPTRWSPGDVLVVRSGPGQHHLIVTTETGGCVHAHAGLRQVTLEPVLPSWSIHSHWRLVPSQAE